jgi:hypothetical protein
MKIYFYSLPLGVGYVMCSNFFFIVMYINISVSSNSAASQQMIKMVDEDGWTAASVVV